MQSVNAHDLNRSLAVVGFSALLSAVIGAFLTALGVAPLVQNLVVSISIGVTIPLFRRALMWAVPTLPRPLALAGGIAAGVLVGVLVLVLWENPGPAGMRRIVVTVASTTMIFGSVFTALFVLQARKAQLEDALRVAERSKLEAERSGLEAQLKMLQAQIEPHFLFNTLANVTALIGTDPALARRLLERLNVYLRASLSRTRADTSTLADELELLRAYLDVCRIRMGERLHYRFDVPFELSAKPFPPMLLQPLVENAIKHGLEPRVGTGDISITARNNAGWLRIAVRDNGVGFANASGDGTGLANVRARLAALYGKAARLDLEENRDGGVTATMEFPA
jgi:sensor histidine kinase YesM